ncbi:MAG: tyrosine-type recombinase/integrase [Rhizobiaceae bacterium]|nr:MAG: tyrosine-type recombinase/integrase [Rhizobiaceae bacterium]MBZ0234673.1 tyrosine-type recombinase/integrase [Kofleriaceae bacterium]
MLMEAIERYIAVRRSAGHAFERGAAQLRKYGQFARARGETHVRRETALDWAAAGTSPNERSVRMRHLVHFARFQHAEDDRHELPPRDAFATTWCRPLPYIYSDAEIADLVAAADRLRVSYAYPLRRETYRTMIGLIAVTGLRRSEALDLRVDDLSADGVLTIRRTKFRKSRLVPLHPTAHAVLRQYLDLRLRRPVIDDHIFLSASGGRIEASVANTTFRRMLSLAKIAPTRTRRPRIHDLRHTFATRTLERCPGDRRAIARQFVALSTYLGHVKMSATHWYLQATPELMRDIAIAAEAALQGGER